jgi:hypothetical protein
MNKLTLTTEQILELIFEKNILVDDTLILAEGSAMELLIYIEDRLINGKNKSKNYSFRGHANNANSKKRELVNV